MAATSGTTAARYGPRCRAAAERGNRSGDVRGTHGRSSHSNAGHADRRGDPEDMQATYHQINREPMVRVVSRGT